MKKKQWQQTFCILVTNRRNLIWLTEVKPAIITLKYFSFQTQLCASFTGQSDPRPEEEFSLSRNIQTNTKHVEKPHNSSSMTWKQSVCIVKLHLTPRGTNPEIHIFHLLQHQMTRAINNNLSLFGFLWIFYVTNIFIFVMKRIQGVQDVYLVFLPVLFINTGDVLTDYCDFTTSELSSVIFCWNLKWE